MKKILASSLTFLAFVCIIGAAQVSAGDITIYDNRGTGTGWYGGNEDQEVEPGMVNTQAWDLEGFFLQGNSLSMVGGFDFKNGYEGYKSGDIFS